MGVGEDEHIEAPPTVASSAVTVLLHIKTPEAGKA